MRFGTLRDLLGNAGKIAAQSFVSWILFGMLGILLMGAIYQRDDLSLFIANETVKLACDTISVFLIVRILDDSDLASLGLKLDRQALLDFSVGFLLIFLLFAGESYLAVASGQARVTAVAVPTTPLRLVIFYSLLNLVLFLFVGWSEELLSRGFHLRILSKGLNRPLAVILSSAIFAYLHRHNPNVAPGYYLFVFAFGLLMAFLVLRTGQLWLAMGVHAGWDFFVGAVVGGKPPTFDTGIFHILDLTSAGGFLSLRALELPTMIVLGILLYFYTAKRKPQIRDW